LILMNILEPADSLLMPNFVINSLISLRSFVFLA